MTAGTLAMPLVLTTDGTEPRRRVLGPWCRSHPIANMDGAG